MKKVLEDIAFLLRHCAPSMGVCCATRGNKHQVTERNVPEEGKYQFHVSENMETRKGTSRSDRGKFRTNVYGGENGDDN